MLRFELRLRADTPAGKRTLASACFHCLEPARSGNSNRSILQQPHKREASLPATPATVAAIELAQRHRRDHPPRSTRATAEAFAANVRHSAARPPHWLGTPAKSDRGPTKAQANTAAQ